VKNIIKANPHTVKDFFQVSFSGYGASGLQVLLYAFLKVPNWSAELEEQQNIYLEILRLAEKIGVEFAFPTQTLHMESFPEKAPRTSQKVARDRLAELAKSFGPNGENSMPFGQGLYTPPSKDPELVAIGRGDSGHTDDGGEG
jgi:MscS family membrane protein